MKGATLANFRRHVKADATTADLRKISDDQVATVSAGSDPPLLLRPGKAGRRRHIPALQCAAGVPRTVADIGNIRARLSDRVSLYS